MPKGVAGGAVHGTLLTPHLLLEAIDDRPHTALDIVVHRDMDDIEVGHRLLRVARRQLRMVLVVACQELAAAGVRLVRRFAHGRRQLDARRHLVDRSSLLILGVWLVAAAALMLRSAAAAPVD